MALSLWARCAARRSPLANPRTAARRVFSSSRSAMAPFALPSGFVHIDMAAAKRYAEHPGEELVVVPQAVAAPVGVTFDAWIQHVWVNGSGAETVTDGQGRGFVNHTRNVPMLQVHEQIQSAGLPNDEPTAVASILYKVVKAGALPIDDHLALVHFVPTATGTEVVWTIKLTLAANGNGPFEDPKALAPFLQKALGEGLAAFAEGVEAAVRQAAL